MQDRDAVTPVRPRVTVAAIVERDGKFLFVEERDGEGRLVLNQPAGHLEAGESPLDAVVREGHEETGWVLTPEYLVGVYDWGRPDRSVSYLRLAIACTPQSHDATITLDEGIERAVWLSLEELEACRAMHRSELVLRCVEDYLAGERYPLAVFKSLPV